MAVILIVDLSVADTKALDLVRTKKTSLQVPPVQGLLIH